MADFLEAGRQDVLEEPADELLRIQGHLPRPVRAGATISERDLAVVAGDDAMVADRLSSAELIGFFRTFDDEGSELSDPSLR